MQRSLLVGVLCGHAIAQVAYTPAPTSPSPRGNATVTYDLNRGESVLFSGLTAVGDTWIHDGTSWRQAFPPTSPAGRIAHAAAYDLGRAQVVVFGGSTDNTGTLNLDDTWTWNGATWTAVGSAVRPRTRLGHSMVYDPGRARIVLFGGRDDLTLLDDTWEWDGSTWQQRQPANRPPGRCCQTMAWHLSAGRAVMCGGWNGAVLADCWVWDGIDWRATAAGPGARWGAKSTYDWDRERVVLFGGFSGTAYLGDTWEWDGANWRQRQATGPTARCCHDLAFDVLRHRTLLSGSIAVDEWFYASAALPAITTYGLGCLGPSGRLQHSASAPWLGEALRLDASYGATSLALFAFGFSDRQFGTFALPLDLAPFGMPGCPLLTSPEFVMPTVAVGGSARAVLALPASPSLAGVLVFSQSIAHDPQANAAGFVTSAGLRLRIGAR